MKAVLFAAVMLLSQAAQETTTFVDPELGLSFTHPTTWTIEKKSKDRTLMSFPIEGSTQRASLEIIRAQYFADIELWQTIQLRANEQLKREVVRQWVQDILDVPMLLTRINYSEQGSSRTAIVGLLYTRTPLKFNFRLTAPSSEFDKAFFSFQRALETLRTLDGSLPSPEDPSKPPVRAQNDSKKGSSQEPVIDTTPKVKKTIDAAPKVFVKPAKSVIVTVSTRPISLLFPEGWEADGVKDNTLILKNPELSGPVRLELFTSLDSDRPDKALSAQTFKYLNEFKHVELREDKGPTVNSAGSEVYTVWRRGPGAEGEVRTLDAYGQKGDYYFLLSYRPAGGDAYEKERKLLLALLDNITLELAP